MTWIKNVEILEKTTNWGKLKASDFAADLWVVSQDKSAPQIYRKPEYFFKVTHITQGLREFLLTVLQRISGDEDADAVIELQSSYGGGKSHSLMACYHILNSSKADTKSFLEEIGWQKPIPKTKVAIYDGFKFNPNEGLSLKHDSSVKYFTPWSLIFAQIGGAAAVKKLAEADKTLIPPSQELIGEILREAGPSVILIDEIVFSADTLQAVAGQKGKLQPNQVANFLQVLSIAVSQSKNCILVYSIPEKESEFGNLPTLQLFQQMRTMIRDRLQRVVSPRLTLSDEDMYGVIRKRIFEKVSVPQKIVNKYVELYKSDEFPSKAKDVDYDEKLIKAYPFHPELLSTIQENLATRPAFQKTRDVLRLLTYIVRVLDENHVSDDLILLGHVPLDHPTIREFLTRLDLGNMVESLDIDITKTKSRVKLIDQTIESLEPLAKYLATAIFLRSLISPTIIVHGSTVTDLMLSVRSLTVSANDISSTLEKLTSAEGCYYLHVEESKGLPRYLFKEQRNLANLLHESRDAIKEDNVIRKFNTVLVNIKGNTRVKCIVNVITPSLDKIPDDDNSMLQSAQLRLIFPGHLTCTSADVSKNVSSVVDKIINFSSSSNQNQQPRKYRNTLAVVIADQFFYNKTISTARNILAGETVKDQWLKQLTTADQKKLDGLLTRWEANLQEQVLVCFSHIFFPGKANKVRHLKLGSASFTNRKSLADRIWDFLTQEDYIANKIATTKLIDPKKPYWNVDCNGHAVGIMLVSDLWLAMCRDASVPRLAHFESLWTSIKEVVKKNLAFLVKISTPKNAAELKVDKIVSEVPSGGSFANYYLIRLGTNYSLRCTACEEWKARDTILEGLCYECQEIACPTCNTTISRRRLFRDGSCKFCKGKVQCSTCLIFVTEEDLRGDKCTRCQGQELCPRCKFPNNPDDISDDGCPNCRGKEKCNNCQQFRENLVKGLCKLCRKVRGPCPPPEPKCLKCGKENVELIRGICNECSETKGYSSQITMDISDLAEIQTYLIDKLALLTKTKGEITINISLAVDKETPKDDHKTINDLKESIQQLGGKFTEK